MELDPMDYYDEFSDWIMKTEIVCNGDQLIGFLEDDALFARFLESKGIVDDETEYYQELESGYSQDRI